MNIGLLGKKIGMTRIYDQSGRARVVTVILVQGNQVLQIKTLERDGYSAVQVGFDDQKLQRVSKAELGHCQKAQAHPKRFIKEFRLRNDDEIPPDLALGTDLTALLTTSGLSEGQYIDVIGQSQGKGFQGPVKRCGYAGQPASHGSKMHRRTGAIGNRSTPGRVWKNMGMPGHMGDERVTVQNLQILRVVQSENAVLVSGPVPGAKGSYLMLRPSKKKSQLKS